MKTMIKICLAVLLAVLAIACEKEPQTGTEDTGTELNQNLTFTLKVGEVTPTTASISVSHDGTSADTWYGFVTEETNINAAFTAKIKELQAMTAISGLKVATSTTVTFEDLKPETKYTYVVSGVTMKGEPYGAWESIEFTTGRDSSVKETSNWKVTYTRGENQGVKAEVFAVECAENLTWYMSTIEKYVLEMEKMSSDDYANYVINQEVPYMLQYYKPSDLFITGPETVAYQRMQKGDYYVFVLGYDANGKATGDYSVAPFTIVEEEATAEYTKWIGDWKLTSTAYQAQKADGTTYEAKNSYVITVDAYDNNFMYAISGWECGSGQNIDFATALGDPVVFPAFFENNTLAFQEYGIVTLAASQNSQTEDLYFGLWGYGKVVYGANTYDFTPVGNEGDFMAVASSVDGMIGNITGLETQDSDMKVTYTAMGFGAMPMRQGINYTYYNDYMLFPITMTKAHGSRAAMKSTNDRLFRTTDLDILTARKAGKSYFCK